MYSKIFTLPRKSGQVEVFLIRRCTVTDLSDIIDLQLNVYKGLPDPGLYALVDESDIEESLQEDYCYGTYHNGQMVAFTMMIANRVSHRNYGTYVGYPEERLPDCVSLEITIVDKEFRGFGLQRLFVQIREEEALRHGAKESLVTIAPDNTYSLNNLLKSGYEIIETRPLYEGALRHILRKRLSWDGNTD